MDHGSLQTITVFPNGEIVIIGITASTIIVTLWFHYNIYVFIMSFYFVLLAFVITVWSVFVMYVILFVFRRQLVLMDSYVWWTVMSISGQKCLFTRLLAEFDVVLELARHLLEFVSLQLKFWNWWRSIAQNMFFMDQVCSSSCNSNRFFLRHKFITRPHSALYITVCKRWVIIGIWTIEHNHRVNDNYDFMLRFHYDYILCSPHAL